CDASKNALASVGSYSDRMLAWRSSNRSWVALSGGSNRTRPMECRNDRGVHGQAAGDGEPYAATGIGGPWAAGTGTEPSWNNDYTIWDGNWLNWYSSGGTVTQTRMEIVRNVANNMLASLNGVNVGLMHFNVDQGPGRHGGPCHRAHWYRPQQPAGRGQRPDRQHLDAAVRDPV
ncbi:MAG: hypothetical protein EDM71_09275, partial [Proteobacteria bacterium]